MTLSDADRAIALRFLAAQGPALPLNSGIVGSHFYGFPSPDSDLDLRGFHLAPTAALLSLNPPPETLEFLGTFEGREVDFTSHEVGAGLRLLLRGNGNVLEWILTPLQVVEGPHLPELAALARAAVCKRFHGHYRGFFERKRRESEGQAQPMAKTLLYAYRVALTGIHLLKTGACIGDVEPLAALYGFAAVPDLLARKRAGLENDAVDDASRFLADLPRLEAALDEARRSSTLQDEAPNAAALSDFLVRLRREHW